MLDALLLSIGSIPWIPEKSSTVRRIGVHYRSSDSGVTALDKWESHGILLI